MNSDFFMVKLTKYGFVTGCYVTILQTIHEVYQANRKIVTANASKCFEVDYARVNFPCLSCLSYVFAKKYYYFMQLLR